MQASTPKWLGYTSLGSIPCLVDEDTAHSEDLHWDDINDINDVIEVVTYLGKATGLFEEKILNEGFGVFVFF
jgi:hypothetical protein